MPVAPTEQSKSRNANRSNGSEHTGTTGWFEGPLSAPRLLLSVQIKVRQEPAVVGANWILNQLN